MHRKLVFAESHPAPRVVTVAESDVQARTELDQVDMAGVYVTSTGWIECGATVHKTLIVKHEYFASLFRPVLAAQPDSRVLAEMFVCPGQVQPIVGDFERGDLITAV